MNCQEFEHAWNDRLDAGDAPEAGLARTLGGHAAACPDCLALDARYRALAGAIRRAGPRPMPPAGFVGRVLAEAARRDRPFVFRLTGRAAALAAVAAGVVAAVTLGRRATPPHGPGPPPVSIRTIDPDGLSKALADAGAATWDLAREASGPAARVGRNVLDSTPLPSPSPVLSFPTGPRPTAEVWRRVEDRLSAGAKPIQGTARHAFGFLLGVSGGEDRPPPRPAEGA